MKKIGIVGLLFAALGLIGIGCGGGAATNECQTLADAYTKASMGTGCSTLFSAAATAAKQQAANCPSTISAGYVSCYAGCISKITDCTAATVATDYATCIGGCHM
jgi:hypothetical protein